MASYDFSNNILFEIFSRVDLKTMKKYRILSKECKDLTYESSFMQLHSQTTSTMVGYLVQSSRIFNQLTSDLVSIVNSRLNPKSIQDLLNFLPRPMWMVATVNEGLVLCTPGKHKDDPFYICKPTTQQWEVIPSPNPLFWTAKISMLVLGSNPLRFKIVRLSDSHDNIIDLDSEYSNEENNFNVFSNKKSWHCEIFDSKNWKWKQSDDLKLTHHDYFKCIQDVSTCGGLHWLVFNDEQDKYTKYTMLSFDGDKEEWAMTSLPDSLGGKDHCDQIAPVSCEGKLGVIHLRHETKMLDVWILNYEKIWIKKHTINLESFNENVSLTHSRIHSFYGADTLFMVDVGSVSFYNFKTRRLNRLMVGGWIKSAYFIQTDSKPVKLKPE